MAEKRPEIEDVDDDVEEDEEDVEEEEESEEKEKKTEDVRNADVVTKYRIASDIANEALRRVIEACVVGKRIYELCEIGDQYMLEATAKVYNKGKVTKGIGFPTCVSVNNVVGACSPLSTDESKLNEGDMVKIDLGAQVDGYVAQVAHTIVVNTNKVPISGRQADVMAATFTAAQCALRLMKPGTKNVEITKIIDLVAKEYDCRPVEGVFSHQVKRFEIDAEKVVANAIPEVPLTGENKTKECKFEAHEAWSLDIVMSTGSGRPQPLDDKFTTVYKRAIDQNYKLKMKASRAVLSEIDSKFPTFPFNMKSLTTEPKNVRFGVVNCVQHRLLESYPVLFEREGEYVAHVKFTALLLSNGTLKITQNDWDMTNVKSDRTIMNEEVKQVLAMAVPKKKKANKKKKKKTKSKATTTTATATASTTTTN